MNASTIIAIVVIAALVTVAVTASIKNRRKGNSCCGCSMKDSCCSMKDSCCSMKDTSCSMKDSSCKKEGKL